MTDRSLSRPPPGARSRPVAPRPRILLAAFATALLLVAPGIALAGEAPTPEERARIEKALLAMGYTSWDEIEREDHGRAWEVDDARLTDGTKWDLKLSAEDLHVIKRERD
jgi:hypothetical protein